MLKISIGINDLVTTHPEIAKQALNWDPTTVTAGSGKKEKWICQKNHILFQIKGLKKRFLLN